MREPFRSNGGTGQNGEEFKINDVRFTEMNLALKRFEVLHQIPLL